MMRLILSILLLCHSIATFAQDKITIRIINKTNNAIEYNSHGWGGEFHYPTPVTFSPTWVTIEPGQSLDVSVVATALERPRYFNGTAILELNSGQCRVTVPAEVRYPIARTFGEPQATSRGEPGSYVCAAIREGELVKFVAYPPPLKG